VCEGDDLQYRRNPGAFHTSIANGTYNELAMHCFFASFAGSVLIDFTIPRFPGELPDKGRRRPPPEIASFFGQEFFGQPFLERDSRTTVPAVARGRRRYDFNPKHLGTTPRPSVRTRQ
jgi:hypothetical protein